MFMSLIHLVRKDSFRTEVELIQQDQSHRTVEKRLLTLCSGKFLQIGSSNLDVLLDGHFTVNGEELTPSQTIGLTNAVRSLLSYMLTPSWEQFLSEKGDVSDRQSGVTPQQLSVAGRIMGVGGELPTNSLGSLYLFWRSRMYRSTSIGARFEPFTNTLQGVGSQGMTASIIRQRTLPLPTRRRAALTCSYVQEATIPFGLSHPSTLEILLRRYGELSYAAVEFLGKLQDPDRAGSFHMGLIWHPELKRWVPCEVMVEAGLGFNVLM